MFINKLEKGSELGEIKPWFKGFSGEVNPKEDGNYEMKGMFHFDEERDGVLHIRELTVGKWTKDYKEYIEKIMEEGPTKIVSMREYHTKNRVHFEL